LIPEGAEIPSVAVPEKPLIGVMVIVDVVDWPVVEEAGVVEEMVTSGVRKVKVAVAAGARVPLVPVTVTV
jgi:hypothetical protein